MALCKLGIRLWARNHLILGENGTKFEWRPLFCFFCCSSPDFGRKMGRNLREDLFFCFFFYSSPDFGRKMGRNLREDLFFCFFFALHLILGEKWDEIWVWQFQILIYVPLKFSEVFGPSFSKSCVRYWIRLNWCWLHPSWPNRSRDIVLQTWRRG